MFIKKLQTSIHKRKINENSCFKWNEKKNSDDPGLVSLCLTFLNILCIIITGILILRIKVCSLSFYYSYPFSFSVSLSFPVSLFTSMIWICRRWPQRRYPRASPSSGRRTLGPGAANTIAYKTRLLVCTFFIINIYVYLYLTISYFGEKDGLVEEDWRWLDGTIM